MKLFSPKNKIIIGTLETIQGVAVLNNEDVKIIEGSAPDVYDIDSQYEGSTDINWNTQSTVRDSGERLFVDEEGTTWKESELVLKEDENA